MKKIKFKNWNAKLKKRLIITIILTVLLTFLVTYVFVKNLSSNLTTYIAKTVKKQNTLYLKDAFLASSQKDHSIDDLIHVIKNSKDEIAEVDFDMKKCSLLLSEITSHLNGNLDEYNTLGYRIEIPIGLLSKNPVLVNVGPKIPAKVELSDVALGNVRTTVKPFGINNAMIEVYIDIFIRTTVLYPFETIDIDSEYSSLVASKVITGTVPNFFGGMLSSQSGTIDIPIDQRSGE